MKAKAELVGREWVEFEINLNDGGLVSDLSWHALGCQRLVEASQSLASALKGQKLSDFQWSGLDSHHSSLLAKEVLAKLKGSFVFPYAEEELCHCRKVPATHVDRAIVLGADTPEKVKRWTAASSQCGTCRPDVQKVLDFRLGKK